MEQSASAAPQTSGSTDFAAWPQDPAVRLGQLGAETPLPDDIEDFRTTLRRFADNVMRPTGVMLDRLSPAQTIAAGSPYWDFWSEYRDLGINMSALGDVPISDQALMFSVLFETLAFGDVGLALSAGVSLLPHWRAAKFGNDFVRRTYPETMIGCWGITEPDRGTDALDPAGHASHAQGSPVRPNCLAKITDGKVVITGQKSAWVSNGPVAELCLLYCAVEQDAGPVPRLGAVIAVPLDDSRVSRGPVLEKLGQRALPQGEIFFDGIELDIDHLLVGPQDYRKAVYAIHAEANGLMGATFTGCAQASLELAVDYAHERRQGGAAIIRHQDVQRRLFHMARKVEVSRAITRRVIGFNTVSAVPSLTAAMMAKVTSTENAFEVASEAVQIFGGNGVTSAYPVEKIFRDARSSLIEDGVNETLAVMGGRQMIDPLKLGNAHGDRS